MSSLRIKKLLGNASLQAIVPQFLGMALFFVFSKWLSKEAFGLMGWCTATAYLIATLASFGLEQVVFRRLAAGSGANTWAARAFWIHNLFTAVLGLLILGALAAFSAAPKLQLLPFFFAAQAALSLAVPLRLLLNARLQYGGYALATLTANLLKLLAAYLVFRSGHLTLPTAAAILIAGNLAEYLLAWRVVGRSSKGVFKFKAYRLLLKEALPQYLTVIFDVSLARLDWFLLGILATTSAVAEYSFAYRAYEVEKLPTAVVGSILLPVVARWWSGGDKKPIAERKKVFETLILLIPALMGWVALLVVALWQPLVGGLLRSEFGKASFAPLALLNLGMGVQFGINLLWVHTFAARKYKMIATITAATAALSFLLNLLLIPRLHTAGAAISLVLAAAFQFLCYAKSVQRLGLVLPWRKLLFVLFIQAGGMGLLVFYKTPLPAALAAILIAYPLLMWVGGIFVPAHRKVLSGLKSIS